MISPPTRRPVSVAQARAIGSVFHVPTVGPATEGADSGVKIAWWHPKPRIARGREDEMGTTPAQQDNGLTLEDFDVTYPVTTRWADNDMYGHVNNAVYYQLFDSAINGWIIAESGIEPTRIPVVGVVAESGCAYLRPLEFPRPLVVGLRVLRVGRSSVTYDLGLFEATTGPEASPIAARGHWVHVYVDRKTRRPVPIPPPIRRLLINSTSEAAQ
jgi:acyl-CoA thioester hydrolase